MTVEHLASNRTSLSLLQNSEDVTEEEVEGFEELEAGEESCEMESLDMVWLLNS